MRGRPYCCAFLLLGMTCAYGKTRPILPPGGVHVQGQLPSTITLDVDLSPNRWIAYLLQTGASAASRRLIIVDLANPQAPRTLYNQPLPAEIQPIVMAVHGPRLVLLFDTQWPKPGGLLVMDVRDPRRPRVTDRVALTGNGFRISANGRFVDVAQSAWGAPDLLFRITHKGLAVPVARIPHPVHAAGTGRYPGSLVHMPPSHSLLDWDPRQGLALTGGTELRVWKVKTTAPFWTLQRTVSIRFPSVARFLTTPATALVMGAGNVPSVVSLTPAPFSPGHLVRVHHRLLAEAAADRKLPVTNPEHLSSGLAYDPFVIALQQAGVEWLQRHRGGLPAARRVEILNDYGFWLAQDGQWRQALPVLKAVVALAPRRSVAWLNLGDTAREAVDRAVHWHTKRTLARLATRAYATYARLTGRAAPAAARWAVLNVGNAPLTNVCRYVADFYNHRQSHQIFSTYSGDFSPSQVFHLDITGNGQREYVYTGAAGTALIPYIVATTHRLSGLQQSDEVHSVVRFGEHTHGSVSIPEILPFKGRYYIVYQRPGGAPQRIFRPDHDTICRFTGTYTPMLTTGRAPALCARLLTGKPFPKVKTTPLPPRLAARMIPAVPFLGKARVIPGMQFLREARVTLDPRTGPVTVASFHTIDTGGRGCDFYGLSLLYGHHGTTSAANTALLNAPHDCHGSHAFLVRADHAVLMELDGGTEDRHGPPPSARPVPVCGHAPAGPVPRHPACALPVFGL